VGGWRGMRSRERGGREVRRPEVYVGMMRSKKP
jgi:hypothetical protein